MKISLRERILIFLVVLSVIVGITGSIVMDNIGRSQCDGYLQMLCREKGKSIDEILNSVSARIDVVASDVEADINHAVDPQYEVYIRRVSASTTTLLKQVIQSYEGHAYAYVKFNTDFNLPDSGCFLEKNRSGVNELEMTDILAYSPDDIEHVGWYYIPKEYGAPLWMEPYQNENVGTYMISYIVPVFLNDEFYCVIGMDIDLSELLNEVKRMSVYDTGYAVLYDKGGNALHDVPLDEPVGYATTSYKLENGMVLTVYVPKREVYPMHYSREFMLIIFFHAIVLVVVLLILLFSIRINHGDEARRTVTKSFATAFLKTAIVLLLLAQISIILYENGVFNKSQYFILQERSYDTTIKAVADNDFEPFSFIGENGMVTGHDVELINAISNEIDINIDLELMDRDEARKAVEEGRADIMLGVDEVPGEEKDTLIHTDPTAGDAIVVYGRRTLSSITELQKSHIAAVVGDEYPDIYALKDNAVMYETARDALHSVMDGTNDYAIVRSSEAGVIISREQFEGLMQVYDLIEIQTCIGMKKTDTALMRQMNSAIDVLQSNGTIEKLREKWMDTYLKKNTITDTIKRNDSFFILTSILIVTFAICLLFVKITNRNRELSELSETDALTNINNRRAGEKRIRELIDEKSPGMFVLFDVDRFKDVNDTYGHSVGDMLLIAIADCFKSASEEEDVVMRFGGDEFAGFCMGITSEKDGTKRIDGLFEEIDGINLPELEGRRISVSLGAVIFKPDEEMTFESLYKAADKGAYESKKRPGNTITFINME